MEEEDLLEVVVKRAGVGRRRVVLVRESELESWRWAELNK